MTIWRLFWMILLGTLIGIGAVGPWFRQAQHDAVEEHRRQQEASKAIDAHVRWLESLPESEKKRWPIEKVCRPSGWSDCDCYASPAHVTHTEVLPNGDVACHETN